MLNDTTYRVFGGYRAPIESWDEARAAEELLSVYSPFSIVKTLTTYFRPGFGLPMYTGHCQFYDVDAIIAGLQGSPGLGFGFANQIYGGGKGLNIKDMVLSSIGESVERVLGSLECFRRTSAASETGQSEWLHQSYNQMIEDGRPVVDQRYLSVFHALQFDDPDFQLSPFDSEARTGWIGGEHLFSGEEVYVPAQMALLLYFNRGDEKQWTLSPSGGLASHVGRDKATYHGITELIERHSVHARWYNKIPMTEVEMDVEFEDRELTAAFEGARRAGVEIKVFYHNLDYHDIPVLTAIAIRPGLARYGYFPGGGVGMDREEALRSALGELSQSERTLSLVTAAPKWEFASGYERLFGVESDIEAKDFRNFIQAIAYYGFPENREATSWYWSGTNQKRKFSELPKVPPEDRHRRLTQALEKADTDPIIVDLTPPDFGVINITKVLMPELVPAFPQSSPALGHPRLYSLPVDSGVLPIPRTYEELETYPVPYP